MGKRKPSKKKTTSQKKIENPQRKIDIIALILIAFSIFSIIALFTNSTGKLGEVVTDISKGLFGFSAYFMPFFVIAYAISMIVKQRLKLRWLSLVFFIVAILSLTTLNAIRFGPEQVVSGVSFKMISHLYETGITLESGGVIGMFIAAGFVKMIGITGTYILIITLIFISSLLIFNFSISKWLKKRQENRKEKKAAKKAEKEEEARYEQVHPVESVALNSDNSDAVFEMPAFSLPLENKPSTIPSKKKSDPEAYGLLDVLKQDEKFPTDIHFSTPLEKNNENLMENLKQNQAKIMEYGMDESFGHSGKELKPTQTSKPPITPSVASIPVFGIEDENEKGNEKEEQRVDDSEMGLSRENPVELDAPEIFTENIEMDTYMLPSIQLLKKPVEYKSSGDKEFIMAKAELLERTLQNFSVNAKVVQVSKGPTVTRYEVQPDVGVKVSSIVRLADDIALNMEASTIRIEAPIPGKAAVGIEIQNEKTQAVTIREVMDSHEFKDSKYSLPFAVGKDISGHTVVADLAQMPHLLIAGSTGSGKSVCINGLITSILYKAKPDEVKLMLIDPKVVELNNYNGIPHLLIPVVTDPSKAAAALNWAVMEMNKRYKAFAEEGVRDISGYNKKMVKEGKTPFYKTVIIIDELADLMMAAPSQVEESICRLAQMARAAGMHLIVATQRPSVDVITGVIKANIPSRIAFAVSSHIDSRTILDAGGAEKLLGKGDMLFLPLGASKTVRIQGAFISDQEVGKVIDFVKGQGKNPGFSSELIDSMETIKVDGSDYTDDLFEEAVDLVISAEQASVSMLQRRFRVGYNRAARIIDMMEERGIVGPFEGSKPRRVILSPDEWQTIKEEQKEKGV